MDKIRIEGGSPLIGRIPVSGAKNAALSLMIASLLTDEPFHLENVPELTDIAILSQVLEALGVSVERSERRLALHAGEIRSATAPYPLVSKMRAAFWVIAPLLARRGEARVSLPGGDPIGLRPVNLYLQGLEKMGAEMTLEGGYIVGKARKGLRGAKLNMPLVSVGATQTLLMAAALASGETVIANAAMEPEIVCLAETLIQMGAKIKGVGTRRLVVEGRAEGLRGAKCHVPPDRIEAGTYAAAAAMTGGSLLLEKAPVRQMEKPLACLKAMGAALEETEKGLRVSRDARAPLRPCQITTSPYPGFPTDLQAQFMALMTIANGASTMTETVFENRFLHVAELARFGASIAISEHSAHIRGVSGLTGAEVMATDLRASASLILAALAAKGSSVINRIYHLDRGFEKIEEKLSGCGARIWRER